MSTKNLFVSSNMVLNVVMVKPVFVCKNAKSGEEFGIVTAKGANDHYFSFCIPSNQLNFFQKNCHYGTELTVIGEMGEIKQTTNNGKVFNEVKVKAFNVTVVNKFGAEHVAKMTKAFADRQASKQQGGQPQAQAQQQPVSQPQQQPAMANNAPPMDFDDDIPF